MLIPFAVLVAGALLLVVAGSIHLARPVTLARTAVAAGLMSEPRYATPLVRAWALVELATGASALAAVAGIGRVPIALAAIALATIYCGFAGFLVWAQRRGDIADCGCVGAGTAPASSTIVRAVVIAFGAGVSALPVGEPVPVAPTMLIGAVAAALAWLTPAALHPSDDFDADATLVPGGAS